MLCKSGDNANGKTCKIRKRWTKNSVAQHSKMWYGCSDDRTLRLPLCLTSHLLIASETVFQRLSTREKSIENMKSTIAMYQLSLWSHRWCFYKCKNAPHSFRLFAVYSNQHCRIFKKKKEEKKFEQTNKKKNQISWKKFFFFFSKTEKKKKKVFIWRKIKINLIRKKKEPKSPNRNFVFRCSLCVYVFLVCA